MRPDVSSATGLAAAVESLASRSQPNPADIAIVAQHLAASDSVRRAVITDLDGASDDVKIALIHRFFHHPEKGTHGTTFDEDIVSDLLGGWFDITLDSSAARPAGRFGQDPDESALPIQTFCIGHTQFFVYMTSEKRRVLDSMVGLLGDHAVLTTDRTSPPSTLAELTPLWLKEPKRDPVDYYICDSPTVDFETFFAAYEAAIRSAFGINIRETSRELGFVLNGDGLRYHRDRLVNQYDVLSGVTAPERERTRVVQDLSLVDWDMQDGTFSGTVFVHPLGDRYAFLLEPGCATSLFFTEPVHLPGPTMMPLHCALPVQDSFPGSTAGEATGKRFSCLVRGVADRAEVDRLAAAAVPVDIHERRPVAGGFEFPSGMRIEQRGAPECSSTGAGDSEYDAEQGCLVTRLSPRVTAALLDHLGILSGADVYRLTKHGDGFSGVRDVLPMIGDRDIVVVNRSPRTPQPGTSFPLTKRLSGPASPVLQLIELRLDQVLTVPSAALDSLYLSPTALIFHRSAPVDAFHPVASRSARMSTILDVVVDPRT